MSRLKILARRSLRQLVQEPHVTGVLVGGDALLDEVALGHAVAAYDTALAYSKQREQFGKPLCSFQIVQERLVKMLAEVTGMQLYCMQLARLEQSGRLTDTIAGLAKLNNTRKARQVIAEARDMLGGNGVLFENHVIRHMGDIEVIHTYEGTRDDANPDRRPRHHRRRRVRLSNEEALRRSSTS